MVPTCCTTGVRMLCDWQENKEDFATVQVERMQSQQQLHDNRIITSREEEKEDEGELDPPPTFNWARGAQLEDIAAPHGCLPL